VLKLFSIERRIYRQENVMKWKFCFMRFSLILFAGALLASPAWAMTTPSIAGVTVQCNQEGADTVTVHVKFDSGNQSLIYEFRNVSTGQVITSTRISMMNNDIPFVIPAGTFNLTVKQPSGQGSQSLWPNIVVPATALTPGQGTGCRFLKPGEVPAVMARPRN
jgi:hypothetical protein